MNDQAIEVRDDRGRLTGRFQLQDGQLHGPATLYANGRVLAEMTYVHGLRHGEMRSYGEYGQISSVVAHADDEPHGEARYFHPDGALARSAVYQQGRLHGEVRDYSPDGMLVSSTRYVEGQAQAAVGAAGQGEPAAASTGPAARDGRKSWLSRLVEG
jgi:antitoxin component YwqK of YwqJK toxin-antitoxin module